MALNHVQKDVQIHTWFTPSISNNFFFFTFYDLNKTDDVQCYSIMWNQSFSL